MGSSWVIYLEGRQLGGRLGGSTEIDSGRGREGLELEMQYLLERGNNIHVTITVEEKMSDYMHNLSELGDLEELSETREISSASLILN